MHTNEPDFWLAFEIAGCGECDHELVAFALSALTVSNGDDPDIAFVVGVARSFHRAHPDRRLAHLSDLTRWLALAGLTWDRLDVDLQSVLDRIGGAVRDADATKLIGSSSPSHR